MREIGQSSITKNDAGTQAGGGGASLRNRRHAPGPVPRLAGLDREDAPPARRGRVEVVPRVEPSLGSEGPRRVGRRRDPAAAAGRVTGVVARPLLGDGVDEVRRRGVDGLETEAGLRQDLTGPGDGAEAGLLAVAGELEGHGLLPRGGRAGAAG
ncbi:hypothetical protein THAOC_19561 [Thalassiosira oceanica]|uniref:Uncharacterized protein n=1 Tax=Thalassiosira oceanica TaxID=159749 RepID=K0SGP1_THAOC|nr:hypothetical protein THAOC_19561 [Thalassiosira oceanica]|eukprot:EJK60141.1 hypothetical protein THAOC_19561 [Thalassiosira oceanica]